MSSKTAIAHYLARRREDLRWTQQELADRSARELSRDYIARVEAGDIKIMYPRKFNEFRRLLGFPGWEALEEMGYRTDANIEGVSPRVLRALLDLSKEDQEVILPLIAMIKGLRNRSAIPDGQSVDALFPEPFSQLPSHTSQPISTTHGIPSVPPSPQAQTQAFNPPNPPPPTTPTPPPTA